MLVFQSIVLLWHLLATSLAAPQQTCRDGWVYYKEQCYYLGQGEVGWTTADKECRALGGYLAEINDESENNMLKNWLKVKDASAVQGAYVGGKSYRTGSFSWSNSQLVVQYADWADGAPSSGSCISLSPDYDWSWVQAACDPSPAQSNFYICESGYIIRECFGDSCYTIYEDDLITYKVGDNCKPEGEYIAKIENKEENDFVKQFLKDAESLMSTEIRKEFDQEGIFISGHDEGHEDEWYFGTPDNPSTEKMSFFDWASGEPDNKGMWGSDEGCVRVNPMQNYQWDDSWCDSLTLYLCESPAPSNTLG